MLLYEIVPERLCSPELGQYDTYSILCFQNGVPGLKIVDVSCEKYFVEHLVKRLNENNVELCHVMDIIHDSL